MGWTSMSFPGSSYLPASTMNAVFSNFASLANMESGSPVGPPWPPAPGTPFAGRLVQAAQNSLTGTPLTAATPQVYSTALVASLTPRFADSLIKVSAAVAGVALPQSGSPSGGMTSRFSACLTRGVTSATLTPSGTVLSPGMPAIGEVSSGGQAIFGMMPLFGEEPSPGSGTPLVYAVRWADIRSGAGTLQYASLLVEEWR